MKRPQDLERHELETIVDAVQQALYLDFDPEHQVHWNPATEWEGADTLDQVAAALREHGMIPTDMVPFVPLPSGMRK
jgi:hypothetical protein